MRLRWHRLAEWFGASARVRFARARAIGWALLGVVSFPLGWAESVVLVWIASVYANVASEMATGEAADDRAVTDRLDRIERAVGGHRPRRRCASRSPAIRPSRLTRPDRRYPGRSRTRV
jgi:hypothetical protein